MDKLTTYVSTDIQMLEYYYGFYFDRFAIHRPKKEYLKEYFQLDGKINCYDRKYFQIVWKHFLEEWNLNLQRMIFTMRKIIMFNIICYSQQFIR